jgi:hypothetical protein
MATLERRTSDPEIFPRCREAVFGYEREPNTRPVQLQGHVLPIT